MVCDFTQHAAHDFAAAGFGEAWGPVDDVRGGKSADGRSNLHDQLFFELWGGVFAVHERNVCVYSLSVGRSRGRG